MILADRFPIRMYRSIALLALLVPCEVLWADTVIAVAPGDADEPKENIEGSRSTPDRAGPIPEDAASNAEGLLEQGESSLLEGQYAKAREHFASAASLDPQDPRSRVSLAFSEFALGDFENAATTVHEVMKMAPDLAATPLDMRGFFGEIDIIEKQLAKLEQIAQVQSKSSRMNFLLGFVRYYSGDRASGAQTLLEYIAANPEDSLIGPFIEMAGSVAHAMPQPDEQSIAQQSERQPSAEPVEAPGPLVQDRPPAPAEPPRKFPDSGQRYPHHAKPPISSPPNSRGPATVVEPRRPDPDVVFPPAPVSENLAQIAVSVFCREEGLDPFDNHVVATVTNKYFDEETGALAKARIKMHWVEWKTKADKLGRPVRKAKPKSETIKLLFDKHSRLTDHDD
jgi:hypothetical protein